MQIRVIRNRVTGVSTLERWTGGRWQLIAVGKAQVCDIGQHENLKKNLKAFRALVLQGYLELGGGVRLEHRRCSCGSTLALAVDAGGNPCPEVLA